MKSASVKRYQHLLICLAIAGCTLAAFWPLQNAAFINYDDNLYVFENRHLAHGFTWKNLQWAFTDYHTGYWHPLTWLTLMVDYQLFGMNAGGYHWTNLLFHLANSLLLYGIFHRMTASPLKSAVVAMFFALHPLHAESVAWISERKDVLSTFFFFLAVGAYIDYAERKCWRAYLAVLILFLLGLMSKPSLVVFPCVLLLLDYWPLMRISALQTRSGEDAAQSPWSLPLIDKIPLFLMSGIISFMTFRMADTMGGIISLDQVPFGQRLQNALISYALYLKKMVWPFDLAVFYPFPVSFPWEQVVLSALVLSGLTGLVLCRIRSQPYLFVGWFWYLGVLFPTSGLFQAGEQGMADRYTYLSLIGIFWAVVWGAAELARRLRTPKPYMIAAAILVIIPLLVLTRVQAEYWKDSISLFEHALRVTQGNYMAHNTYGLSLMNEGRVDEALQQYRKALALRPGYANAHNNIGLALMEKGQTVEAALHYREALRLVPQYPAAHINLGIALARQNDLRAATDHLQAALAIDSHNARAYNNLGIVLARSGDVEGAVRQFRAALDLNPHDADVHNNLGISLTEKRDFRGAVGHFSIALQLKPNDAAVHNNLGLCLANAGYPGKAKGAFLAALRLKPDFAEARRNLEAMAALESSKKKKP
jgi:protein O-mannosyl-transferase